MYILLEMQTNAQGATALVPPATFSERNAAEAAFHTALAAAAVSSVPVHAVALLDERGATLRREYYEHVA